MSRTRSYVIPLLVIVVSVIVTWLAWPRQRTRVASPPLPLVLTTSRLDLNDAEAEARRRLAVNTADTAAGVRLAEILLRKARIETDARHAVEAERVLRTVLTHEPAEYSALKLLGAVLLSQHRFAEATEIARRALTKREVSCIRSSKCTNAPRSVFRKASDESSVDAAAMATARHCSTAPWYASGWLCVGRDDSIAIAAAFFKSFR